MSGLDDSKWIAANSKKYYPVKFMYTSCDEEPTQQQNNEYLKIMPGSIERYEHKKHSKQKQKVYENKQPIPKKDDSKTCADQSVVVENPKGRIMTIVNFYHGRSGYDFSTVNSMWKKIFDRYGLMRSILYFENKIEAYKNRIKDISSEYLPPKSQNEDIHEVTYNAEQELIEEFSIK